LLKRASRGGEKSKLILRLTKNQRVVYARSREIKSAKYILLQTLLHGKFGEASIHPITHGPSGCRKPELKLPCRWADIHIVHPSSIDSLLARRSMMTVFVVILLANSLTLVITIAAAIKRPILRYKLISGVALCATLVALHQVITGQGNPFAVIFTILLIVMIAWPRSI
jgi:hypothetical protein